jgi:hypothetical protein
LSPFLKIAITCAIFQLVGYLHCRRDLLKIIWRGAAIFNEKCELLNKYFSFISSLEDANVPLPDIELKTDNFLFVTGRC